MSSPKLWAATSIAILVLPALEVAALAQSCPAGSSCFYVPPAYPAPPGYSVGWDMVLASPRGTISGTWRSAGGTPVAFSVSPGTPQVVTLGPALGTASTYGVIESRGLFIEASAPELIVDHRLIVGPWQSSSTVKNANAALGTRFRLASYNLNGVQSTDTGFDAASVYAPFGASVTFEAPNGAALPFWAANAQASFSVTLAPGETYLARTVPAAVCTRELMGALVTATAPIAVESGGRGWALFCGITTNCGDDGTDNLLPVSALGTQYVVHNFPPAPTDGEDIAVVADYPGTEVRFNGTLVATLNAGEIHRAPVTGLTYVETSTPAYVFQNSGLDRCEIDLAMIPPVVLAPVGGWVTDFNVSGSGRVAVLITTAALPTLRRNGTVPTFLSNALVPGRSDLTAVQFTVAAGNHSIAADADFQLGLVTAASGTGLFGYYTPYRVPGCGDGVRGASEGCDDGGLDDGDGCSSTCRIELGTSGCTADVHCVPAGRCEAGTCVARCLSDAECVDASACTVDTCDNLLGTCAHVSLAAGDPGECVAPMICSGAPSDLCVECVSDLQCAAPAPRCDVPLGACVECLDAMECDDLDPCTVDACGGGTCTSTRAAIGSPCPDGVCDSQGACVKCIEGGCPDAGVDAGVDAGDEDAGLEDATITDSSTAPDASALPDASAPPDAAFADASISDATIAPDAGPTIEDGDGCSCGTTDRAGLLGGRWVLAALALFVCLRPSRRRPVR